MKTSKMLPVYDSRPYIVTSRKGGEVTATRERPRHTITRNVSFFKKFDAHQGGILKKGSDADADEEELLFEEEAGSESSEGEEEEDLTDVQDSESEMICQLMNLKKARWRQVKYHNNEIIREEIAILLRIYPIIKWIKVEQVRDDSASNLSL